MFTPTEEQMKERYKEYLYEVEAEFGTKALDKAMTFEEWKTDQKQFGYYAWYIC